MWCICREDPLLKESTVERKKGTCLHFKIVLSLHPFLCPLNAPSKKIFFHNNYNLIINQFSSLFENFRYSVHRNLIGLGTDDSGTMIQINIPEPYWNTTSYRSTLGHKANHSFVKIKAMFNFASHPRFGWVRALTAIEDIYQGSMK